MSAISTMSNVSVSSYIPPSPCSPGLNSSPSTYSLSTPPDSIRQYSTALKAKMVAGMRSAMADMHDIRREAERQFDTEFGYDDEDPIDRHVRMFLTPRKHKSVGQDAQFQLEKGLGGLGIQMSSEMEVDEAEGRLTDSRRVQQRKDSVDEDPKPFQPGLIKFHRTHSQSHPSRFSAPSLSRTDSGSPSLNGSIPTESSTPFIDGGIGTPGSDWSEASFEAGRMEDYVSLYGDHTTSASSLSSSVIEDNRSSMASTITTLSTSTVKSPIVQRPSLARPRPRQQGAPYPSSVEMRARERTLSGGDPGKLLALPSVSTPMDETMEEDWLQGRTISETMIAQAGLRCQRGRANRRV